MTNYTCVHFVHNVICTSWAKLLDLSHFMSMSLVRSIELDVCSCTTSELINKSLERLFTIGNSRLLENFVTIGISIF